MTLLGIETSCDETAAAVIGDSGDPARPWAIRSNVVASQVAIHREWGGVVPELASRQHVRDICGVVEQALDAAGTTWDGLDAVAVTQGPGLVGSLLVGLAFAKAAAWAHRLPLVAVNHLAGHIESLWLAHGPLPLPAVVLVVSGGHTSLYLVPEAGEYRLLGRTRDDAAGEAYDKVAKLVGLGYPGGPVIDRLAATGDDDGGRPPVDAPHAPRSQRAGARRAARLQLQRREDGGAAPRARPPGGPRRRAAARRRDCRPVRQFPADGGRHPGGPHLRGGAAGHGARSIGVAGGVSANTRLRAEMAARGQARGLPVFVPPLALATDNAAMIAAAGVRLVEAGRFAALDVNAAPSLTLG